MIAGVCNDPNAGIPRLEGYRRALWDNGIEIQESLVCHGDYKYKSGYELMKKLLTGEKKPTAVFAASDIMAIGAASAALHSGLRIPEDLSVIGFDDIETAEYFYPPISTVRQPRYEMGAKGMEHIIRLLRHENVEEKELILDFELIERKSHRNI